MNKLERKMIAKLLSRGFLIVEDKDSREDKIAKDLAFGDDTWLTLEYSAAKGYPAILATTDWKVKNPSTWNKYIEIAKEQA